MLNQSNYSKLSPAFSLLQIRAKDVFLGDSCEFIFDPFFELNGYIEHGKAKVVSGYFYSWNDVNTTSCVGRRKIEVKLET